MWTLFTIFFTALIGNTLAARWQHRNWIAQQKVSLAQKKSEVQMALLDEIERLASSRRFHTARFAYTLETDDEELIKKRFEEFDKTIVQWNERFPSFLARLRIYKSFDDAVRLEEMIHTPLFLCASDLNSLKAHDLESRANYMRDIRIQARLNDVTGSIIAFSRDYLNEINKNSTIIIDPDTREFKEENLQFFSTLFLLKSLFRLREKYLR
jgi:hypothetical protein